MSKSSRNHSKNLSLDASVARKEPFIFPDMNGVDLSVYTNLLFIDQSVKDYQDFITSANPQTFTIAYSSKSSREELLALLKKNFTSFQRIGIVFASIGSLANPFLNSQPFFRKNESAPHSDNVRFIVNLIKDFGVKNIDYLGCNTLEYSNWVNYYSILTEQTGVVVGASNDETGNIKYGGDWVMESTGTDVELIYFTKGIEYYKNLLDLGYCSFVIRDGKLYGTGDNGDDKLGIGITTLQQMINQTGKTVKSIACGDNHTIVLMTDDTVYGTGDNLEGQLGNGEIENYKTTLTRMKIDYGAGNVDVTNVKAIACGGYHTIVLMNDGTVYATGAGGSGQLGNGGINNNSTNVLTAMVMSGIPTGLKASAISGGGYYSIVLMEDGTVYGTGANWDGQLGDGNSGNNTNILTPMTTVPVGKTPDAISCGYNHTIVLMTDGTVFGTGDNYNGQLGIGTYYNSTNTLTQMTIDDGSTPVTDVKAISCGDSYTIVLKLNGTVYGTGANWDGQLGTGGYNDTYTLMPMTSVPVGKTPEAISCGDSHTIVLMTDGTVYGTGENSNGQLGAGNINEQTTLTQMTIGNGSTYVTDVKAIICGGYYTMVLKENNSVFGTGDNEDGQFGNGSTNGSQTTLTLITSIPEGKTPLAISCGRDHTIVLMEDGSVYGTGDNGDGELGTGDDNDKNTFTPMTIDDGTTPVTNVKAIACGKYHSIVLMNNGTVYGTGENYDGELGTGDNDDYKTTLTEMKMVDGEGSIPVTNAKAIASGNSFTIVLMENGSVYGTGENYNGQLGNQDVSDTTNLLIPMQIIDGNEEIVSVTNAKAIACGDSHTIVLMNDGTLYGTGDNYYGQLGTGDTTSQTILTPMINETGKTPIAISCGQDHTIVLMSDGTVYGIGSNNDGQLGDLTIDDIETTLTPMIMPEGLKAIAITTGRYHTVVLMNNGTVYGTGDNNDGQLGTGDENSQTTLTPMTIGDGITPVTNVSRLFDNDYYLEFTEEVSCLLEGTLVLTKKGYLPIETLKPEDTIITKSYFINIAKVGKWSVDLNREEDRNDLSKKMYKIPAGKYGAKKDTYISHYHRILYYMDEDCSSRGYDIPINLGLKPAEPEEFTTDNGKYNLYHLQLVIGNHFIVNGECMVEAWNPKSKHF
jgi:alpha-tubulin suppressor-like RCC1 family protein